MKRSHHSLSCLALTFLVGSTAASAGTINVTGQNNSAIDRPAIQAAVDSAQRGDTILLEGTFQLDGTPVFVRTSHLTVAGKSVDNDGDGSTNEDRPDGVDNDGDSQVDEDGWEAVILGVDDGFGGPSRDVFPNRFNDAFEVLGFDQALRRIVIRDIEFQKINRGVYLFPDYDDAGTVLLCDSATPRSGRLDQVTVKNNAFVNGVRGVEILGRVRFVNIRHNTFSGIQQQSVLLFGQTIGCAEADGEIEQFIPLGTPFKVDIADNELSDVSVGLMSFISNRTSLRRNDIRASFAGVLSVEDERMFVGHNSIQEAFIGVYGTFDLRYEGPSKGNFVWKNTITDNLYGIIVDCVSTGYTAMNNEFSGSVIVDVLLDGTAPGGACEGLGDSFENRVIATRYPTTVEDYGVDNQLIGKQIIEP